MKFLRFLWSLLRHKWFVILAGRRTKVPPWRLLIHDWSKFTSIEFSRYTQWHFGNKKDKGEWAAAWHHHQRVNAHHPEYWLLSWRGDPSFYNEIGERIADYIIVLPMPEVYVREMIADCMGASKAYTGSWNIAIWLNENGPKMLLHSESIRLIAVVMYEMGYMLTDNCDWSWLTLKEAL